MKLKTLKTIHQKINNKIKPATYQKLANIAFLSIFAIFVSHSAYIGGDAFNGYERDGKFYVNWHGVITETSQSAFITNKTLGIIFFTTTALYFIFTYLNARQKSKKFQDL